MNLLYYSAGREILIQSVMIPMIHPHLNPLYIYSEYLRKVPPAVTYGLKGEETNLVFAGRTPCRTPCQARNANSAKTKPSAWLSIFCGI